MFSWMNKKVKEINEDSLSDCEKLYNEYLQNKNIILGKKTKWSTLKMLLLINVVMFGCFLIPAIMPPFSLNLDMIKSFTILFVLLNIAMLISVAIAKLFKFQSINILSISDSLVKFNSKTYKLSDIKDIRYKLTWQSTGESSYETIYTTNIFLTTDNKKYEKFSINTATIPLDKSINFVLIIKALITNEKNINQETIKRLLDECEYTRLNNTAPEVAIKSEKRQKVKKIAIPIVASLFSIGCLIMVWDGIYSFIGYNALKKSGISTTATIEKFDRKFNVFNSSDNDYFYATVSFQEKDTGKTITTRQIENPLSYSFSPRYKIGSEVEIKYVKILNKHFVSIPNDSQYYNVGLELMMLIFPVGILVVIIIVIPRKQKKSMNFKKHFLC